MHPILDFIVIWLAQNKLRVADEEAGAGATTSDGGDNDDKGKTNSNTTTVSKAKCASSQRLFP